MFRSILVAVDSSPARHSAVRLAGEMARLTGAAVGVLHIAASTATLATIVSLEDDAQAKAVLDEAVTSLRDTGVEAEGLIANALTTQIATTISAVAEERQADLLVLGPHHRGLLQALVSPRVTDSVVHNSRTAVLLAPADGSGAAG
ncbi:universal stress protein [Streptomyces sp. NPDC051132]|uniref:universal stress protein n=1 Tax=unclassified Streptomyces TaxID=2593676 RepID=UPI0034337B7A